MNWNQLRAFLWLRWRLRRSQIRRGGVLGEVLIIIFAVLGAVIAILSFVATLCVGAFALKEVSPRTLLFVWDGIVVGFLFIWVIGLLTDLQRSEVLSLEKFLHLPVSPAGAFLINYLSSLVNVRLIFFVPALVGLAIGLTVARGPWLLLSLPLLAAFFLMVTALTNQFQGWLAAIMMNQRRRRAIIVFVTLGIVLIGQAPNLIVNFLRPARRSQALRVTGRVEEQAALLNEVNAGRITPQEYEKQSEEIEHKYRTAPAPDAQQKARAEESLQEAEEVVRVASMILPPGWLALGIMSAAEASAWPALLGTLGLGLIGAASLRRSYRTTLRLYTGQVGSGRKRTLAAEPKPKSERETLLEWRLPGLSEQAAAVALSSVRWLLRAPEAKLMLLGPLIMTCVLGSMLVSRQTTPPEPARPLMAAGAMAMALLGTIGFVGNQFGIDRSGFRVFVLSAARRRDILLGKNVAFAPVTLGFGVLATIVLQCVYPMSFDLFLSVLLQFLAMYLVICLLGNLLSILSPMYMTPGTLRPVRPRPVQILFQILFALLFPVVLAPTMLPYGIEIVVHQLGYLQGIPICLPLTVAGSGVMVVLYHVLLSWEGSLLQAREQKILDVVAPKAE